MEETFSLAIPYRGRIINQDFVFRKLGYTYKIFTTIASQAVVFEPDEEGSFRGALYEPFHPGNNNSGNDLPVIQVRSDQDRYKSGVKDEAPEGQAPKGRVKPLDLGFIQAIIGVLTSEFK